MLAGGLQARHSINLPLLALPCLSRVISSDRLRQHQRYSRRRLSKRTSVVCAATVQLSFYAVLGIRRSATLADIKSAYRRLAKQWHPDRATSAAAAETYETIRDAYDVLRDPATRAHYDKHGVRGLGSRYHQYRQSEDSATPRSQPRKGADVDVLLGLTFLEAALGTQRVCQASVRAQCAECSGSGVSRRLHAKDCTCCNGTGEVVRCENGPTGRTSSYGPCPRCGGKGESLRHWCKNCGGQGRAQRLRNLRIKIPAGVDRKSMLRLRGQGDVGFAGGPSGDIMLHFMVHPEKTLRRIGSDVYSTISLPYTDAILGTQMDVQTLRGTTTVQIEPGTQPGATVKLPNQGVQVWGIKAPVFGAHYLTVKVLLPSSCTEGEQELLGRLKTMARTACA